ncbi:unnamed protein product [Zymoseptoria tritici ST99CH_3D1]|nr:unnamed protein product [Zymoseptoria tritici ST99CH_3D1]
MDQFQVLDDQMEGVQRVLAVADPTSRARHHLGHCYPLVALGKTRSGSRKVTRHSNVGVEKVIEPARRKTVASAVPAAIPAAP